jgi:hypothetical protein
MKAKKTILFGLIGVVLVSILPAETILTADDAVRVALDNNLSLNRSRLDVEGKRRNSAQSWNSLVPSLSAAAQVSHAVSLTDSLTPMQDVWVPAVSVSAA